MDWNRFITDVERGQTGVEHAEYINKLLIAWSEVYLMLSDREMRLGAGPGSFIDTI